MCRRQNRAITCVTVDREIADQPPIGFLDKLDLSQQARIANELIASNRRAEVLMASVTATMACSSHGHLSLFPGIGDQDFGGKHQ